ncbi:MAG: two-component system sensor histidine kinase NtrB [Methyloligellaceae bacterium]
MDRVTDRTKPIADLGASGALLAAVLDQVGEAIISIGEDQRITMFNKRAEELFGYASEEAVGRPVGELIPKRFRDAHGRFVETFLASGETSRRMGARVEISGLRRDGSEFPAEAAISRVQVEGRIIATVIIQDITERRQQMEALRESEARLIQAEKVAAIGTMASGIGHEINNPLYAILGRAEVVRDEKDISSCRRHGEEIIKHSKHIAAIVRDLAGYVRPGAERDLEIVDVNDQLREAVSMVRHALLGDHIEIKTNLGPVAGVLAKPEEIRQVFFNVIRNGVQAIEGRGSVEIDSCQEGDRASVRVRDTGPGIPKDHQGKVFDPFFTTKGPDQGQGLGLYIVKQLVEKYEGAISLESGDGAGTTFCVELPVAEGG